MSKNAAKSTSKPAVRAVSAAPTKARKPSAPRPIRKQALASLNALSRAINGLGKSLRGLTEEAFVSDLKKLHDAIKPGLEALDPTQVRARAAAAVSIFSAGDELVLTKTAGKFMPKYAASKLLFGGYTNDSREFATVDAGGIELTVPAGFLKRQAI